MGPSHAAAAAAAAAAASVAGAAQASGGRPGGMAVTPRSVPSTKPTWGLSTAASSQVPLHLGAAAIHLGSPDSGGPPDRQGGKDVKYDVNIAY